MPSGVGLPSKTSLGFGCVFFDVNLDGWLDLMVANGHIDDTVRNIRGNIGYAQPPQLFLNHGKGTFREVAAQAGTEFAQPKVGRGVACGDFDRDGDLDLLVTTNNGAAYLYRNDQNAGNRSVRFRMVGTKSNRDGIGTEIRLECGGVTQSRMVKSGSSYLSQSELPLTFGLGKRDVVERVMIYWPSGRTRNTRLSPRATPTNASKPRESPNYPVSNTFAVLFLFPIPSKVPCNSLLLILRCPTLAHLRRP